MFFICVALLLSAGCGTDAVSVAAPTPAVPAPTPPAATVTRVVVSGLAAISSDAQMTASAGYSDGTIRDVTALASWESSAPGFATVSSGGAVTVVGTGSVELRATYQTVVGTMRVAVTKPDASTFALTGIVRDSVTNAPLPGVELRMLGGSSGRTTTNQAGVYILGTLPAGRILIELNKSGYRVLEISVTIIGNQSQDVALEPAG